MRLPRSPLLERVTTAGARGTVVVEAPAGYGKSWLLRRAFGSDARRLRGELGALDDSWFDDGLPVVIDDAHLLTDHEVALLAEFVELAPDDSRLVVAGRIIADRVHEAVQLVDGTLIDATMLTIPAGDIVEGTEGMTLEEAERLADVADGCVRTIRTAFAQARQEPGSSVVQVAAQIVRADSMTALQQVDEGDRRVVGLLARSAGLDRHLLARFGGPRIIERLAAGGVPVRRDAVGIIHLATSAAFRSAPVEHDTAIELAGELMQRERPIEAVGLLLDAGDAKGATGLLRDVSESLVDIVDPRVLLGLLGRLGAIVEREPLLLLLRSGASTLVGRMTDASADIDRAAVLVKGADPVLRRRVQVETARARLAEGHRTQAVQAAEAALVDVGTGEERTYARAHEILAECASTSETRADLQRAFEHYRTAISAWESCSEFARARSCRSSLAMGVLEPLGRNDEALAQLAQLLADPDVHETERSWTLLFEGFVLANSGRLDSADECFRRCADLGLHQDNPRLGAAAAWGRAVTAMSRGELDETLKWIAAAESTAPEDDDVLGVPFLADASMMLGALGAFELAERYLARAVDSADLFPERVALARFYLTSRQGAPGDVTAQLAKAAPSQWWRVLLISAHAAARAGDLETARQWSADAERELKALGFDDAAPLGERREQEALWSLLRDQAPKRIDVVTRPAAPATVPGRRRLVVIGSPMAIIGAGAPEPIPPGNPQRLVGVVVAHGGSASFDHLSDSIWPGDEVEASRTRLRNVLLRLRKVAGDVVMRSGSGVRLSPEVDCDLLEFEVMAADAMASLRADPDLAGRLASRAVEIGGGTAFPDFEYEEWAIEARHATDQRMIALLDVLSVQAEDGGDLPAAQALAERALRLDRYTDSRYVRLAELLTMQDRNAAAVAVLQDAAAVARELGAGAPTDASAVRRDELLKNAAGDR